MLIGNIYLLCSLLWLLGGVPRAASQPVLARFSPRSGPTRGGTTISVWGNGFVETTRCNFANLPAASIPSLSTTVHNSTFMTCILPEFITAFQFPENNTSNIIQFGIITSTSEQSSQEDFLVFNLTNIVVTRLSPSRGLVLSSDNHVQFSGTGFVNTSEVYCFVGDLREPAAFINDQIISCQLPSYSIPSLQYPQLSLNGDDSGFVPVQNNSNQFIFYSSAPVLESAKFSSSAAQLVLTFDREVELGQENSTRMIQSFGCSEIFDTNTSSLLGEPARCDWQTSQQRVIIIQLHANSLILPGNTVALNGASIRTRGVEYSMLSNSTVIIPPPEGPVPVAVLEAPGTIPACGMLKLVARNSLYGGGRPLVYEWSAFTGNETLNDLIESNNESFVEIPVHSLANSGPYNFTISITNFLDLQDSTTISYTHKSSSETVLVTIHGSQSRSYPVDSDSIVIEATAEVMSCSTLDGVTLEYMWTVTDSSNGRMLTLGSDDINNSELWIPPLMLQVGTTYDVEVTVQYMGQPSTTGMATIQVTGLHPEIVAAIQTGYRSSVRVREQVYLDTSPSRGLLADQTYQYLWQCSSCGLPDSDLLSTSSTLILPANTLLLGGSKVTVTITHSGTGTSSTASTILQVMDPDFHTREGVIIPSVKMSLPTKWNALSADDKTIVKASVIVPTAATIEWSTVEVKSLGFDHKPVDDLFTNTPKSYSTKSRSGLSTVEDDVKLSTILVASSSEDEAVNEISLTINPNALKSGVSYRMRLNATTEDGYSAIAEVDITTENQPTSGSLLVSPSNGAALDTTFILTAVDWTDDFGDPPLLYQFGFRLSQQSTKIYWLSSVKFNSQILSYLPIASLNSNIVLVLRVYDRSAAFVTHEMSFSDIATTANGAPLDAQVFISSIREQVFRYGQVSQGLASLTAVIASVNEHNSKFTNVASFRNDAADFLLDMSSQISSTKSSLNQILFLLHYVTNGMTISSATQQRLATFLERIVEEYQLLQDNFVFSTPGFNTDEASAVFALYGRMLGGGTTRLQSNEVSLSYRRVVDQLGYGMCRQLGLNEETIVTEETYGSLRLSHYTPANQFTASCVSNGNNHCPFTQQNVVDIDFGLALFNRYISWQCKSSRTCSGVCLLSVQLLRSIWWNGDQYLWHSKSSTLSLYVINPIDGDIELVEDLSEPVELQFPVTMSSSTSQCVFWDVRNRRWSPSGCDTIVEENSIVCSCDHFSEFTVLAVCPSGYYGDQCQFTCPSTLYGEECDRECVCSADSECSPVDGSCNCNPGYTGPTCSSECDEGYYGNNCLQQCDCLNGATCDHVTGMCACTAGWTGVRCEAKCPQGQYGLNCIEKCSCRNNTECHHVTGICSCHRGYTGEDCLQECPYPLYGDDCRRNCTSQCHINGTVSMECHHIEGPNCTCHSDYTGELCQTRIVIPTTPSPVVPVDTSTFPIVVVIIPLIIVILIVTAILVGIVIHWRWKKRHSGKAKIAPTDDEENNTEMHTKKSLFDGEDGIHLTKAESLKILSTKGSFDEEEDEIQMTRAKSLTVIVPPGAKLQDMFSESQQGAACSFKEPAENAGKFRWQIIHLKEKDATDKAMVTVKDGTFGSQELLVPKDKGDDEELALKQITYHQGVYVDPDATLREVRDLFIETGQLELDQLLFQFLDPNSHNRLFSIEEEDVITLDSLQLKLPRTLFIKSIPASKEANLDFCLCGRVAEFECTDCSARGYCSVECQQEDWHKHMTMCKKQRRKKKKSKNKKKKGPYQLRTPDPNVCVCGAPAEMECSQCGIQGYCSEECQLADWEEHQLHCEPRTPSRSATPTNNSTQEMAAKNQSTLKATGSVPSVTADTDKPKSNEGSVLGSNDSLMDDKV